MIIYFDGGCQPNPGKMEAAIVSECGTVKLHARNIGHGTNNEAEWIGLLMAAQYAMENDPSATIRGDSKMVISQASGVWKCNAENLKPFLAEYKRITGKTKLKLEHVRRGNNPAGVYLEQDQKKR